MPKKVLYLYLYRYLVRYFSIAGSVAAKRYIFIAVSVSKRSYISHVSCKPLLSSLAVLCQDLIRFSRLFKASSKYIRLSLELNIGDPDDKRMDTEPRQRICEARDGRQCQAPVPRLLPWDQISSSTVVDFRLQDARGRQ